jgi:ribosome-binding protein aMBF1 (putative translation factor)
LEADINTSAKEEAPPQVALPRLGPDARKQMVQARLQKKWKQEDLAKKVFTTPKIIQDLENGKEVQEKNILVKINRELGTKLRFN